MDAQQFPDIPPRKKPVKRLVNQVVMFVLGRALQSLSIHDPLIQHEVKTWPENFTLMLVVRPKGGSMAVTRLPGGRLAYRGAHFPEEKADVIIYMKSVESAFAMFTGQLGIDMGYAQHTMCARGDLSNTVSVVRVLDIAEAYLFPAFISRNLMKRLPPTPFWQKQLLRLKAYFIGIPFGL